MTFFFYLSSLSFPFISTEIIMHIKYLKSAWASVVNPSQWTCLVLFLSVLPCDYCNLSTDYWCSKSFRVEYWNENKRIFFSWVRCSVLHTACCSRWCSRKLPTQLADQGKAWGYYYCIRTLCSHLLCDYVFVCAYMSVWTWAGVGRHIMCRWMVTSITTKLAQSMRDFVKPAKNQTYLSAVFLTLNCVWMCVCVHKAWIDHKEGKWNSTMT